MPAEHFHRRPTFPRRSAALLMLALAAALAGCGGSQVQTTPTSLEKPPLAVPEGSLAATSSKKSGSTSATSTSNSSTDTSTSAGTDTGAGTGADTGGAGTDTGGADNGAGTGTGTGGADTGGAGPGN